MNSPGIRPTSASIASGVLFTLSALCLIFMCAAMQIPDSEEPGAGLAWHIVMVPAAAAALFAAMAFGVLRGLNFSQVGTVVALGLVAAFPYHMAVSGLTERVFGQGTYYASIPPVLIAGFLILVALVGVVTMLVSSSSFVAWLDNARKPAPTRGLPLTVLVAVTGVGLLAANVLPLIVADSTPDPRYPTSLSAVTLWSTPVLLLVVVALPAVIGLARGRERGRILAILACTVTIAKLALTTITTQHHGLWTLRRDIGHDSHAHRAGLRRCEVGSGLGAS